MSEPINISELVFELEHNGRGERTGKIIAPEWFAVDAILNAPVLKLTLKQFVNDDGSPDGGPVILSPFHGLTQPGTYRLVRTVEQ